MKIYIFFAVILPMFIYLFYLISQVAFAQNETQKFDVYEGLGIKMKYFDPWTVALRIDEPTCNDMCFINLVIPILKRDNIDDSSTIWIFQEKLNSPKIKDKCKCDTLLEYVKYQYENIISKRDNFYFINDNTTILNNNKSAIQLEYEHAWVEGSNYQSFDIFTQDNNSFYKFSLDVNKNQSYPKYLNDFKKMIDSLKFVSSNESKQKQPSFMLDTNESNDSSPILNLTKDNALNLSNNGEQQSSESLESNNKIDIPSHNSYINSIGHLHVIGEVENNSPVIAEFVKIIGTFYDANGNVVGTSSTYADPTDIHPGEKAPFDLILSDSIIPADQIDKYLLKISYR
jgi:hypothetical protein